MKPTLWIATLFLVLMSVVPAMAQEDGPCKSGDIEQQIDKKPKYTGPHNNFKSYFAERITVNDAMREVDQTVTVRFVVNCKGKVSGFKVLSRWDQRDADPEVKEQVLKLSQALNSWIPGIKDGKAIDAYAFISVRIKRGKVSIL